MYNLHQEAIIFCHLSVAYLPFFSFLSSLLFTPIPSEVVRTCESSTDQFLYHMEVFWYAKPHKKSLSSFFCISFHSLSPFFLSYFLPAFLPFSNSPSFLPPSLPLSIFSSFRPSIPFFFPPSLPTLTFLSFPLSYPPSLPKPFSSQYVR